MKQTKTITRPVSTTTTITTIAVIVNLELFVISPNILRNVNC